MNKKGFTLIELLVVVLIIGILAAIAVPQYQKAVLKTRFATMKDIVRSVIAAEERYFLANGDYTTNLDDLDITYPKNNNSDIAFSGGYCSLRWWPKPTDGIICILNTNPSLALEYHFRYTSNNSCRVVYAQKNKTDTIGDQICQQETGKNTPTYGNGSNYYEY